MFSNVLIILKLTEKNAKNKQPFKDEPERGNPR